MYYVTMTDKALSRWGRAEGRINKLVFICEDYEQAVCVETKADNRREMIYVNICSKKPYYDKRRYYTQYKTIKDYPAWFRDLRERSIGNGKV